MTIDWIIPCRYGEVHDNLATMVGAGIDTYTSAELPTPIGVGVAVRLLATHDEVGPGQKHTAKNIITGPDGTVISEMENEFEMNGGDGMREDWLNGIALFMVVQFEAMLEGTYSLEHIVDGSSRTVPFHVCLAQN